MPIVLYQVCYGSDGSIYDVMIRCREAYKRSRKIPLTENVHFANRFIDRKTDIEEYINFEFVLIFIGIS